jgi:hypothetical protein
MDLYTVGHSTHSLDDLVTLLRRHEIAQMLDMRTTCRPRGSFI